MMMNLDLFLRIIVTIILSIWLVIVGFHMETSYPPALVEAYALPLTRVLLLGLVVLSSLWCPTVGILAAMAYICLGADVIFFTHGAKKI